jgi:hypothetical protein
MKSTDQKYYLLTMFIVQGKYFITLGESGFYLANPVVAKLPLSICRCGMTHRGASKTLLFGSNVRFLMQLISRCEESFCLH